MAPKEQGLTDHTNISHETEPSLTSPSMNKTKCSVLGATGAVSQRFVVLLESHSSFELIVLDASERYAGKTPSEIVKWVQSRPMPEGFEDLVGQSCVTTAFKECDVVSSGLDNDRARGIADYSFKSLYTN